MNKRKIIVLGVMLSFVVVLSSIGIKNLQGSSHTFKSTGPPACYAGEPGSGKTCASSGCHTGYQINSGAAQVSLDLGDNGLGYEAGKTYNIKVQISKPNLLTAGFQIIAIQDNDQSVSPGTITLTNANETQILNTYDTHGGTCDATNKSWVEHTYNGINVDATGVKTWNFNWKAPSSDVGSITFYLATLEANDDQDATGDRTYTLQKKIGYKKPDAINDQTFDSQLKIFPNPATSFVEIDLPEGNFPDFINIIDNKGVTIKTISQKEMELINPKKLKLNVNQLNEGLYFLNLKFGEKMISKKLTIRK